MRAPSEIRCRSIPKNSIATNTAASTSGIARATTAPARRPRLTRLTASTMATASHSASMNSSTACSTVTGWSATSVGSIPTGRFAVISVMACCDVAPESQDVAAFAHGDGEPDALMSIDAEHRLRGIGGPARDVRDVAEANDPAVLGDEVDGKNVLLGPERTRDADEDLLVRGLHDARRGDGVLGLQRGDQRRRGRSPGPPTARSRIQRKRARPGPRECRSWIHPAAGGAACGHQRRSPSAPGR